jgi:small subunit ribosomal protein S19e
MSRIIHEQEPGMFNTVLAEELKKIADFTAPEWSMFVKTGVAKQRVPQDDDFWYKRAASILRQLYIHGVVGVGSLRTRYGARKNRGGRPSKFKKASGKIIRTILQQAEKAGLVEKVDRLQHGRRLTLKGKEFLDSIKAEKPTPKEEKKEVVEKPKEKTQEKLQEIEDGKETQQKE